MNCLHKWISKSKRILSGQIVQEMCVCEKCGRIRIEEDKRDAVTTGNPAGQSDAQQSKDQ